MTNEEALDRVKYLSKELSRTDLTREETLERYAFRDKEISDEILSLIHNYPIMFDCNLNEYRLENEEEVKIRRHPNPKFESWLNKTIKHPFVS